MFIWLLNKFYQYYAYFMINKYNETLFTYFNIDDLFVFNG